MTETLHPDTRLGAVHLTVSSLDRSLGFYQNALGFTVNRREGAQAFLGAGGAELLTLLERPGARTVRRTTGLYHFAILTPSRLELAKVLRNLAQTRTPVDGFADHLVSEAIYLPDPDGNGIEVYRDRPRSEWPHEDGHVKMATDPLDIEGIYAELKDQPAEWTGLHPRTVLGHMHLRVAQIDAAEAFYRNVVGFDLITRFGSRASFVSAGGYHHHLGMNTWESAGAPPPPPDATGLRWYDILVPSCAELDRFASRAAAASVPLEQRGDALFARDPSGNGVRVAVGSSQ